MACVLVNRIDRFDYSKRHTVYLRGTMPDRAQHRMLFCHGCHFIGATVILEPLRYCIRMKYPIHTQSKPVVGEAARKLIEAIEAGQAVTNERALALAKRIADRRQQSENNAQSK
jgi:hypothetical protein